MARPVAYGNQREWATNEQRDASPYVLLISPVVLFVADLFHALHGFARELFLNGGTVGRANTPPAGHDLLL